MYAEDLTGYLSGQFLGGLGGAWLLIMVWGARAANIHNGITAPGPGYSIWFVFLAEFGMTLVNWFWTSQWLYWVALPIGGLTAALLFHFLRRNRRLPTAKLFHTPNYRCIFKNVHVPHIPVNR